MRTSAGKQKRSLKCQEGRHTSTDKTKRTFIHTMIFFLFLTQMAEHRTNFHCLARLGWALSPPKEGNVYWRTELNGVSMWCLNEPDLGTAGGRFNNFQVVLVRPRAASFSVNSFRQIAETRCFYYLPHHCSKEHSWHFCFLLQAGYAGSTCCTLSKHLPGRGLTPPLLLKVLPGCSVLPGDDDDLGHDL